MALPKYADADLVTTALLVGGIDPQRIQDALRRSNGDPRLLLDEFRGPENDEQTLKIARAAESYVGNLGRDHLQVLLEAGGLDKNLAIRAVNEAQGGRRASPTIKSVLDAITKDPRSALDPGGDLAARVQTGLKTVGMKGTALTTTRTQYRAQQGSAGRGVGRNLTEADRQAGLYSRAKDKPTDAAAIAKFRQGERDFANRGMPAAISPAGVPGKPGAGGGGAGGAGGPPGGVAPLPPNASEAETRAYFAKNYGHEAWMLDVPDLRNVMTQVAKNPSGWTPDSIQGAISNTQWWRDNGQTVASWMENQASDPAGTARLVQEKKDAIASYAHGFGIAIPDDRLTGIATNSLKFGWDDTKLHAAVGSEFHYTAGGGDSPFVASMKQSAKHDWLVPITDQAIQQWGTDIASGRMTPEDFNNYMRDQASSMWPGAKGFLDSGGTMGTFVAPYKKVLADTLELSPDSIDFTDPKYMGILNQTSPKGDRQVMSLNETQVWARQQPEWGQTQNAHQIVSGLTDKLAQTFGKV